MNKSSVLSRVLAGCFFVLSFVSEGCDCGEVLVPQKAFLLASETQIDFGEVPVGFDVTRVFSVTKDGERTLKVDGFAVTPDGAPFAVEGGVVTLTRDAKQDYIVHFRPTEIQAYEGELEILHDGDNDAPVTITLKGIGVSDRVCTDCGGKAPECLDNDVQIEYQSIGGCEEDQCLYQAVQVHCECGCEAETGMCASCEDAGVPMPPVVPDAGPEPVDAGNPVQVENSCDLRLVSYDTVTHEVVVEMTDATNCGCNEATKSDGSTCGPQSSSTVNNNESVNHLVFGLHYEGPNAPNDCIPSDHIHTGWAFATPPNEPFWSGGWETGETLTETLTPFSESDWNCLLDTPLDGRCWEIVIWQINLSQTADTEDFPAGGWTNQGSANGTQMYPDFNLSNNRIVFCP